MAEPYAVDTSVAAWQKSSFCNGASSCVEVSSLDGCVLVRDSKLGDASPVLRFTVGSWWSYIAAVKTRQLGTWGGPVLLTRSGDEPWRMWHERDWFTALEFTDAEVEAFVAAVNGGEFDPDVLASGVVASGGDVPGRPPAKPLAGFGADSAPV